MPVGEPVTRAVWPECRDSIRALARRLVESGGDDADIMRELQREYPGLLLPTGPEWRRDAVYHNVIAMEQMAAQKRRGARPLPFPAGNDAGAMSPGLVAFAEARGLVCAYCGSAGTRSSDSDGQLWWRDSVPRGFQVDGRDLELACTACRGDRDRYHRLGGDSEAI
jgi:hypothetical protein